VPPIDSFESWEAAAPAEVASNMSLEDALKRLPAGMLETLDEVFRARPARVVPKNSLKLIK
jgi:hypothetical protein